MWNESNKLKIKINWRMIDNENNTIKEPKQYNITIEEDFIKDCKGDILDGYLDKCLDKVKQKIKRYIEDI